MNSNVLLIFTIQLDKALANDLRVTFNTEDGTAIAGSDYTALSAGNMTTFNGGDTEQEIAVSITDDTTVESMEETFTFVVSNPTGMQMSRIILPVSGAIGTIVDSDTAVVTIADITVNESDGNAVITAQLDNPVAESFTVNINSANDTAIEGMDYTAPANTLTFTAGATPTDITVPIVNNDIAEITKTFTVGVVAASISPANLFEGRVTVSASENEATVTLVDDDTVGIILGSMMPLNEGDTSTPTHTVRLAVPTH